MKEHKHIYQFPLRVLLYQEETVWVSHALEMDIVSQGDTREEAMEMLVEAISCQISYCIQEGMTDTMYRSAPEEYFEHWRKAQSEQMHRVVSGQESWSVKYYAEFLTLKPQDILSGESFEPFDMASEPQSG